MGAKAEYTFAQAIAMVNWLAEEWSVHTGVHPFRKEPFCEHCQEELCAIGFEDDGDWCERGQLIQENRAKWHRRVRYAAKREGVKMTFITVKGKSEKER